MYICVTLLYIQFMAQKKKIPIKSMVSNIHFSCKLDSWFLKLEKLNPVLYKGLHGISLFSEDVGISLGNSSLTWIS